MCILLIVFHSQHQLRTAVRVLGANMMVLTVMLRLMRAKFLLTPCSLAPQNTSRLPICTLSVSPIVAPHSLHVKWGRNFCIHQCWCQHTLCRLCAAENCRRRRPPRGKCARLRGRVSLWGIRDAKGGKWKNTGGRKSRTNIVIRLLILSPLIWSHTPCAKS